MPVGMSPVSRKCRNNSTMRNKDEAKNTFTPIVDPEIKTI
jgi:hypothetical protein